MQKESPKSAQGPNSFTRYLKLPVNGWDQNDGIRILLRILAAQHNVKS